MTASFTDLAEGRRLLDAMREEEKNTGPHDPRPYYVEWLIWARNNAEAMMNCIEALAQREPIGPTVQGSPRRYEGKCMSSAAVIVGGHHVCDLEFGHHGAHQDENGMSWTQEKTEPAQETRTEWGLRRPPRFGSTIAWMTNRGEAESLAASWDNGSKVVSRTVYVGSWREVEQ